MKDHFWEEVAVKHNNTVNRILYYFSWLIIIFTGLIAAIMLSSLTSALSQGYFGWQGIVFFLVSAGVGVAIGDHLLLRIVIDGRYLLYAEVPFKDP